MTGTLPRMVTITRPRHPLEGRPLRMLGSLRRHGRLELLLVLPNGSKSLIPAAWTHLARGTARRAGTPRRRWGGWVTCWPRASWFPLFVPVAYFALAVSRGS